MWPTFFIPSLITGESPFISSGPVCGYRSTPYNPSTHTPGAKVGNYVVLVVWYSGTGVSGLDTPARLVYPSGWDVIVPAVYDEPSLSEIGSRITQAHAVAVIGKFLESSDLSTTVYVTSENLAVHTICSQAFVFENIHPDLPVATAGLYCDGRYNGGSSGVESRDYFVFNPPMPCYAIEQPIVQVDWSINTDSTYDITYNPFGEGIKIGNTAGLLAEYHNAVTEGTGNNVVISSFAYTLNPFAEENMFPGETNLANVSRYGSVSAAEGWIATGVILSDEADHTKILANSGSTGRHAVSRTATLVAGDKYTFAMGGRANRSGSSTFTGPGPSMCVVDPSGNEIGFGLLHSDNNLSNPVWVVDDLGGRYTTWGCGIWKTPNDGAPSKDGGWCFINFTAPESGTYTFYVGVNQYLATGPEYTASSNQDWLVHHVVLRKGWHSPSLQYTPAGETVTPGDQAKMQADSTIGYWFPEGRPSYIDRESRVWSLKVVLNPNWSALPPAVVSLTCDGGHGLTGRLFASPWLYRVSNSHMTGDDERPTLTASRCVWPTKDGSPGKYYFEVKINYASGTTTSPDTSVGVRSLALNADEGDTSSRPTGYVLSASESSFANGNVIGVTVDYENHEVKFYKNNVLVKTWAMQAGYPSTYSIPRDVPLTAYATIESIDYSPYIEMVMRLREHEWTYSPPTGFIEYDWIGDDAVTPGNPP